MTTETATTAMTNDGPRQVSATTNALSSRLFEAFESKSKRVVRVALRKRPSESGYDIVESSIMWGFADAGVGYDEGHEVISKLSSKYSIKEKDAAEADDEGSCKRRQGQRSPL